MGQNKAYIQKKKKIMRVIEKHLITYNHDTKSDEIHDGS